MEYLLAFGAIALFLAGLVLAEAVRARRQRREFIDKIRNDYLTLNDKKYSPDRFERLKSYYDRHRDGILTDEITWNDLGMDELFKRMNYTLSASGEEYLYYLLHDLKQDRGELERYEQLIQSLGADTELRTSLQFRFSQLGYTGKYSLYDYIENLDYLENTPATKLYLMNLLFLPLAAIGLFNFSLSVILLVAFVIYKIVTYFRYKGEIDPYITSFAYIIRLLVLCEDIEKDLAQHELPAAEEVLARIHRNRKALDGMRRNSFWIMSGTRGNASDIVSVLCDYLRMIFHLDIIKFFSMLKTVRAHLQELDGLITDTGYLESVLSVWIFRQSLEHGWCVPRFEDDAGISVTEGYHPLLTKPVNNSISAERGVLLTGSNASGKSTFLKMVAINAILAQSINTCAAKDYRGEFFRVYSSMALRDDISGGDSYYIVEIKALKRILDAASEEGCRVLCFVDEVLRGTNTIERIAASAQILRSLGENVLCFAATHDIELTSLLDDKFDNYHFEEEINEGDIHFNYRLKNGKATTRNAIKLLELMGYSREIIEEASAMAETFLRTGAWNQPVGT